VDNQAPSGGNGSLASPWNVLDGSFSKLNPGNVLCVRGNVGSPRVYAEAEISVDGINGQKSGTAQSPITVRTYPGESVMLRVTGADNVIELRDISYWVFDGFNIDGQSTRSIGVKFIRAHNHQLRNCDVHHARQDGLNLLNSHGNRVEGCAIHHINAGPYQDGTGVIINGSNNTVVRGSTLYDLNGDGVQLYDGFGAISGTLIENNHFYTTLGRCSENAVDMKIGGTQTTVIRGNRMHGFRPNDGACGGSGGGLGEAIIIHESASNVDIDRNEIYDSAGGISITGNNVYVTNNLIRNLVRDTFAFASIGIYAYDCNTVELRHNTLASLPDYALWVSNVSGYKLYNNLLYSAGKVTQDGSNSISANYNGWFSMPGRLAGANDTLGSAPGFVGPGDYHLVPGAMAVDKGASTYNVSVDFDGAPRPYGNGPDLGAFEVQAPPAVNTLRALQGNDNGGSATVTLGWVEVGQSGQPSPVQYYELRYYNQVITAANWAQATVLNANLSGGQPGAYRQMDVTVPYPGSGVVYFALRVTDTSLRESAVSNPGFWPFKSVFLPLIGR
jgi:hypothetical protein